MTVNNRQVHVEHGPQCLRQHPQRQLGAQAASACGIDRTWSVRQWHTAQDARQAASNKQARCARGMARVAWSAHGKRGTRARHGVSGAHGLAGRHQAPSTKFIHRHGYSNRCKQLWQLHNLGNYSPTDAMIGKGCLTPINNEPHLTFWEIGWWAVVKRVIRLIIR